VYTALFGSYDRLVPQPAVSGIDFVCFTDQPISVQGWDIVPVRSPMADRLAARDVKTRPHRWVGQWRRSIWIDASVQILSRTFVTTALDAMQDGLALFPHPDRDCIYDEAEILKTMPEYATQLGAQIHKYRAEGFPRHVGLWATGVIAREHCRSVRRLGRQWFDRCQHESVRDQVSLPPLLRSLGIAPGTIPGNLWDNKLIRVRDHLRESVQTG